MKKFICKNEKCNGKELESYMEVKYDIWKEPLSAIETGELMICPECSTLYLKDKQDILVQLEDESFLISNIDSPVNNSIKCDCGGKMCRASKFLLEYAWFICPDCHRMLYAKLQS